MHAECTRCLKPIKRDWTVNVTSFFPYEDKSASVASGKGGKNGKGGVKEEEVDIIAGEDESEDSYPLLEGGSWADIELCCVTRWLKNCRCSRCANRIAWDCVRSAVPI